MHRTDARTLANLNPVHFTPGHLVTVVGPVSYRRDDLVAALLRQHPTAVLVTLDGPYGFDAVAVYQRSASAPVIAVLTLTQVQLQARFGEASLLPLLGMSSLFMYVPYREAMDVDVIKDRFAHYVR